MVESEDHIIICWRTRSWLWLPVVNKFSRLIHSPASGLTSSPGPGPICMTSGNLIAVPSTWHKETPSARSGGVMEGDAHRGGGAELTPPLEPFPLLNRCKNQTLQYRLSICTGTRVCFSLGLPFQFFIQLFQSGLPDLAGADKDSAEWLIRLPGASGLLFHGCDGVREIWRCGPELHVL